jgi:hypothetical protein
MTRQAAPIALIPLLTASSELGRDGFGRPAPFLPTACR